MKNKKLCHKITVCFLALLMIFSTCTTAFAVVPEEGVIHYVSLGDSMTNGYGLLGYDANTGVEDYGEDSYANLFEEWLGRNGATVDHKRLAMSAMRAEDLHWLLELDYENPAVIDVTDSAEFVEEQWVEQFPTTGDYWTWKELCDDYRFAVAAYTIEHEGDASSNSKITRGEAGICGYRRG